MNLKTFFLHWQNKHLKPEPVLRKNTPFAKATSIGILFHADDEQRINAVARLVGQLEQEHKKVKVLAYTTRPISVSNKLTMKEFVKKDVSALGTIRTEPVREFINTEFDYLFCLHTEPFLPFDYILLRSHARCRVGRYEPGSPSYYDLMIEVPEGTLLKPLIEQMLTYVKKFQD